MPGTTTRWMRPPRPWRGSRKAGARCYFLTISDSPSPHGSIVSRPFTSSHLAQPRGSPQERCSVCAKTLPHGPDSSEEVETVKHTYQPDTERKTGKSCETPTCSKTSCVHSYTVAPMTRPLPSPISEQVASAVSTLSDCFISQPDSGMGWELSWESGNRTNIPIP